MNLIKFLLSICIIFNGVNSKNACAQGSETSTYAKALLGCNLYKTQEMSDRFEDIYFQIPETYFMVILDTINDDCFKVQYDKYIGYVDSGTVMIATFIPVLKTLDNITFDIKSTSGTQIWQYPTTKSNICTTISAGAKNISYIAYTYGSVPSGGESNIWYYVYYIPDSNSTNVYEGYVYSENTTNLTEIVANTETNPEVIANENKLDDKLIFISSTIKTIIIAIIAIPIILFFAIILYKFVQKFKKNTKYIKNQQFNSGDNDENLNNNPTIEKYKNLKLVKNKNPSAHFIDFNDDELL